MLHIQDIGKHLEKLKDEPEMVRSGLVSQDPAQNSGIYKVRVERNWIQVLRCNLKRAMNWLVIRFLLLSMIT